MSANEEAVTMEAALKAANLHNQNVQSAASDLIEVLKGDVPGNIPQLAQRIKEECAKLNEVVKGYPFE